MSQPSVVFVSSRVRRALHSRVRRMVSVAAAAAAAAAPAHGAELEAEPAAAFRDSIGVQTHFSFPGYAYDTASVEQLKEALRAVGIRHLRDDTCFLSESACARVRERIADLADTFGADEAARVDLTALISRELASTSDRATRDADLQRALLAASTAPLRDVVAALEPVNEPDLKNTSGWAAITLADRATLQRLLDESSFSELRELPLLSPALGRAANTATLLEAGWQPSLADIPNFHPYPPAWGGPEEALDVACGTDTVLGCAKQLGGDGGPYATESGYTTAGSVLSTSWVSEQAQAVYLPRLLLENFRRGVARTYLYELIDRKPSSNALTSAPVEGYGLYRAQQSGSGYALSEAKPAGLAVARMNATIGDLGVAPGAATPLGLSIEVDGEEPGENELRRVLLQRADGSYVLALWQPKAVWQNAAFAQSDVAVPELSAEIAVDAGQWNVQATRPSLSAEVTATWDAVQRWSVPVGADVTLIELRSADAGTPTSVPSPTSTPLPTPAPNADVGDMLATAAKVVVVVATLGWLAHWIASALGNSAH
ncbi:MAG: hypothetical protein QM679_10565 [Patulibacter sp.]